MEVQVNERFIKKDITVPAGRHILMVTPPIDQDYWLLRVRLSDTQAIVGFPKFGTIGVGFQVEAADWNTNLPYTCDAEKILSHIAENKGDVSISYEACLEAIRAIQEVAPTFLS